MSQYSANQGKVNTNGSNYGLQKANNVQLR
jgi:hypothetical protein